MSSFNFLILIFDLIHSDNNFGVNILLFIENKATKKLAYKLTNLQLGKSYSFNYMSNSVSLSLVKHLMVKFITLFICQYPKQ